MKALKFTEAQKAFTPQQGERSMPIAKNCCRAPLPCGMHRGCRVHGTALDLPSTDSRAD